MNVLDEIEMIGKMIENDQKLSTSFDEFVKSELYEKYSKEGRLMERLNEGRQPIKCKFTFERNDTTND